MKAPADDGRLRPEFISAISHELRSPLNVILGYNELLRDQTFGPLNAEQEDALQRIGDNAHLLLERLNCILEYSRIQAGDLEVLIHPIRIGEVLRAAADSVQAIAHEREAAVAFELRNEAPAIELQTDSEKLVAALAQVLANAFKFTDKGVVSLTARLADAGVELVITDTGIGIAPEICGRIFEPFFKVDGVGRKGFRDFGLGLYIARSYCERLGGEIEVASEPGRGSTFRLRLPLRLVE